MLFRSGGYVLGENWEDLRAWMRPADFPIVAIVALAVAWYVWHKARELRREEREQA